MNTLEDLKLKPKDLKKVKMWLNSWKLHFEHMAQGDRASIERYDLENLDFFFFTDCRDILSKKPESAGVETNKSIRKRKEAMKHSLIFRFLLGEKLGRKRPCSHCGNDDRWINSLGDGTGHYVFCPKCKMTTIVTYPEGYDTCTKRVAEDLAAHNLTFENTPQETYPLPIEEAQKRIDQLKFEKEMSDLGISLPNPVMATGLPGQGITVDGKLPKEPPLKTVPKFPAKKHCTGDCCIKKRAKKDTDTKA